MNEHRGSGWHCMNLGDAMLADAELERIQTSFEAALASGGGTAGGALFVRHESEGQLHCDIKVYFSPAASALARRLGAVPSAKPAKYGLSLLAGDPDGWAAFEESGRLG